MATKKEATKKKATTKKATTKKTTKKVVKEEKVVLGPVEPTEEEAEKAIEESIKKVIEMAESNEPIVVEETEVMNGDPAVLTPIEEEVEIEEAPKEEKPKITKRISKMFTYLWNGQMIDF